MCTPHFRWVMPVAGCFAACIFFAGTRCCVSLHGSMLTACFQRCSFCLFVQRTLIRLFVSRLP